MLCYWGKPSCSAIVRASFRRKTRRMTEPDWSDVAIRKCLEEAMRRADVDLADHPLGIAPELSLNSDLELDSLQLMEIARHLESSYAFRFSLQDWLLTEEESGQPVYTVESLARFVQKHRGDVP